jgi:hypothetical protein
MVATFQEVLCWRFLRFFWPETVLVLVG